MDRVSDKDLS